jgi:hypothetical protein
MSVSSVMDLPRYAMVAGVQTTSNRASTPEEIAARCADKLVHIPEHLDEEDHGRAQEFKARITTIMAHYISEAIKSDRNMLYIKLDAAGHADISELIRSF